MLRQLPARSPDGTRCNWRRKRAHRAPAIGTRPAASAILHAGWLRPRTARPRRERKRQKLRAAGRAALGPSVNPCCPELLFGRWEITVKRRRAARGGGRPATILSRPIIEPAGISAMVRRYAQQDIALSGGRR